MKTAHCAAETARHTLETQLRLMETHAKQASRRPDGSSIHDLRVAIRRFRTALRVFRDLVPGPTGKSLRHRLKRTNRKLGPIRDAQVWHALLTHWVRRRQGVIPADWAACVRAAEAACEVRERAVGPVLASIPFSQAWALCPRVKGDEAARSFLAKRVHRAFVRLLAERDVPRIKTDEEAHALRRRCRRARYLAEFAGPLLGPSTRKLALLLKAVADALGDRHDAAVQGTVLDQLAKPPDDLRRMVARRLNTAQQAFRTAWRRLADPRFEDRLMTELEEALVAHHGGPA